MWSDPVADMLTRVRNAVRNHSEYVMIPRSKLKLAIGRVLKDEGLYRGYRRDRRRLSGQGSTEAEVRPTR